MFGLSIFTDGKIFGHLFCPKIYSSENFFIKVPILLRSCPTASPGKIILPFKDFSFIYFLAFTLILYHDELTAKRLPYTDLALHVYV